MRGFSGPRSGPDLEHGRTPDGNTPGVLPAEHGLPCASTDAGGFDSCVAAHWRRPTPGNLTRASGQGLCAKGGQAQESPFPCQPLARSVRPCGLLQSRRAECVIVVDPACAARVRTGLPSRSGSAMEYARATAMWKAGV